jgi:hypothetical protein
MYFINPGTIDNGWSAFSGDGCELFKECRLAFLTRAPQPNAVPHTYAQSIIPVTFLGLFAIRDRIACSDNGTNHCAA